MRVLRPLVIFVGLLAVWQAVVVVSGTPHFILPGPLRVWDVLADETRRSIILSNAGVTFVEILAGLLIGSLVGGISALTMALYRPARDWLLPVFVVSQAIPVFALAPILVLWLGYGMPSKIAMAVLIIYFPVTAAFYDGLRRTDPGWIDLARVMNGTRWHAMRYIRLPSALPAFGSGLRIAAATAPIGAVVGEWVGSSAGLGYLMLHSNARMQTDMTFAALFVLAAFSSVLYFTIDAGLRRAIYWDTDTGSAAPASDKGDS